MRTSEWFDFISALGPSVFVLYAPPTLVPLLSVEVEAALKQYGLPTDTHVHVLHCDEVLPLLSEMIGNKGVTVHGAVPETVKAARSNRIAVIIAGQGSVTKTLEALAADNLPVGVIAHHQGNGELSSNLRSAGAMDVFNDVTEEAVLPLLNRGLDFRAILALELASRCEARRLMDRELEIIGQPPESMSDDLTTFQPPPLPVGPMSVFNLEEASECFERAYIDRVQQLCGSAREAALHLGVSSATLSRRLRRETTLDGS